MFGKKDKLKELEKQMQKIADEKNKIEQEEEKKKEKEEKPKDETKEEDVQDIDIKSMSNGDVLKLIGKCFIHLSGNGKEEETK